ncbi:YihY/virulence factor BrkB family protein [Pseudorhodoplanes sinuspersici]|uniref:Ribonuclease BN n=1 Tax=Pseudorhodoplanes sinuspersici TaxID=1235591 RepID=A0A1W6ZRY1_9HYPH|nr:YihY/virulence factor BrkB family protein [Pseudorhodoplanes sinuspersici]ARQ00036.1 ribonuclease BN [Pseudorhodoplanes sinuspersici]RKE71071.1 membrane protein [Pseudorhodoplanes sinuspersici]
MAARKRSKNRPHGVPVWVSGLALAAAIGLAAYFEKPRKGIPPARKSASNRPFGEARSSDEPRALQLQRAAERGRGRRALSLVHIPIEGWRDIVWRTVAEIGNDRLLAVAAGVVFYGLLALFPAITALVSSYALFADAATIGKHLAFAAALMPASAFGIVEEQITRIAQAGGGQLSSAFIVGLLLAIWSANAGMKAMIDALNVIYDETEKRSFIKLNFLSLAMTLGVLAFLLIAIGAVVVLPLVFSWLGIESWGQWAVAWLRWPAIMIVIAFALSVLYRFGPSRRQAKWRWLSVGAVVATLLWVAGSALFSWYLSNFADYNATYGSLGAGIGLMMWLWLTSIAILIGAELNAEIEHQTARDTTVGHAKPLGGRGAEMADTVGAVQD